MSKIYLDHNATTPIDPRTLDVFTFSLNNYFGNPSSIHAFGREARAKLIDARHQIADFFGVRPQEVIFNSGATEGLSGLIQSIQPGSHIITSVAEHACVYESVRLMQQRGCEATFLPTGLRGCVDPSDVQGAIRPNTRMIVLMAVNNETGVKTDVAAIADLAEAAQIPFIVDGVAWLGKECITLPRGISAICFSGHKIHAPKGIGLTIQRHSFKPRSLLLGGGQEGGRRAGTENLPGILALAHALELLKKEQIPAIQVMTSLRERLEFGLLQAISNAQINGSGPRICNTVNMAFPGVEGESILMALDLDGIAVSHGSACASGALEPSRVLLEMGLSRSLAETSLRFSLSRFNTEQEIDRVIDRVAYHYHKLSKRGTVSS